MTSLVLNNKKLLSYFNNINSENIGFYFSFLLHFLILIFAIGLPNFFKPAPINVPNIIPIEIINVTETTSIPKKIESLKEKEIKIDKTKTSTKKFNNSNNQEIKKIEQKVKPSIEIKKSENLKTPKEDIIIKEKNKTSIKLEKEKKNIQLDKVESLPTKKIKPKLKPKPKTQTIDNQKNTDVVAKVQPKPKPEPEFSIASMLKDLRNETSTQVTKSKLKEKTAEDEKIEKNSDENKTVQLSISEIDLLRQQLSSCWIAPAGAVIEKGMLVKISAKVKQNRTIYDNSVRIVDTNISKSNSFYGPITESAMRTLLNPDCIPLKLPKDKYSLWKNLTITFDYSIMKGYE